MNHCLSENEKRLEAQRIPTTHNGPLERRNQPLQGNGRHNPGSPAWHRKRRATGRFRGAPCPPTERCSVPKFVLYCIVHIVAGVRKAKVTSSVDPRPGRIVDRAKPAREVAIGPLEGAALRGRSEARKGPLTSERTQKMAVAQRP